MGAATGEIVELDADGNVFQSVPVEPGLIANVSGLAVDPQTGLLWVADSTTGKIWSVDLDSGGASQEIEFSIRLSEIGALPIDLHAPSLTFSPDGERLVVSDAGNRGWLWVFNKETPPPPNRFRRGDASGTGTVDISDPILVLGFLFLVGGALACLDAADADDSGVVDISDAIYALAHLFLGGPAPAPPGPIECGSHPTGDGLGECDAGC